MGRVKKLLLLITALVMVLGFSGCTKEPEVDAESGVIYAEDKQIENGVDESSIKAVPALPSKPAQIGDWVETKITCPDDAKKYKVYYRITDVNLDAADDVKKWNETLGREAIGAITEPEKYKFCSLKYDIMYPKDFPDEKGITKTDLSFLMMDTQNSGGFKMGKEIQMGFTGAYDVTKEPKSDALKAGSIYHDAEVYFVLPKRVTEFNIQVSYGQKKTETYVRVKK